MNSKSIFLTAFILFINLSLVAQKRFNLSKETTTTSYNFDGYTQLDIASDFEVELNFSDTKEEITLETNSNLLEFIDITKKGNTLVFRMEDGLWNMKGNLILKVNITTRPIINKFNLSSDAVVKVNDPLTQDSLELNLKSDSTLSADIKVNSLMVNAKSDAVVTLSGIANSMKAALSSDSQLKADNLTIQDVKIKLASDSKAEINVTGSLDANASGDALLRYSGNPSKVNKKASGDAEIISYN